MQAVSIRSRWPRCRIYRDDLAVLPLQLDDFIGVLFEEVPFMMADHQYLKTKRPTGVMDDFYQFWDQIRTQPAVLLVQDQKATMRRLVQCR